MQGIVGIHLTISLACTTALKKLDEYYTLTKNQRYSHLGVATICDPRMNPKVFQGLWPTTAQEVKRNRVKQQFHDVFNKYKARQYNLNAKRIMAKAALDQSRSELELDSNDDLYVSHSTSYQEPEWKRWILKPRPGQATDILKYWAAKQYQYLIVARIARDYLAIPATSAPSERVFSNGADILTKKRNRLSP